MLDSSSVSAWAAPSGSTKLASTLSTARMPCAHAALTVTDRLGARLRAEGCVRQQLCERLRSAIWEHKAGIHTLHSSNAMRQYRHSYRRQTVCVPGSRRLCSTAALSAPGLHPLAAQSWRPRSPQHGTGTATTRRLCACLGAEGCVRQQLCERLGCALWQHKAGVHTLHCTDAHGIRSV